MSRASSSDSVRDTLLQEVPDTPENVELRALLRENSTRIGGDGECAFVFNPLHYLAIAWRNPGPQLIDEVLESAQRKPGALLCATRLPYPNDGWRWEPATIYVRPRRSPSVKPIAMEGVRIESMTAADVALAPQALQEELNLAVQQGAVVCARTAEEPVAFAYAPHRSEAFFDLSVDTVPGFRGRGLGRAVAARLIEIERQAGREPVWGTVESNLASHRVARAIGFSPHGLIWVATPTSE